MPSRWKRPSDLLYCGHLALALQDVDLDGGLVVRGGGEDLALLGRDGGVAVDELGEHAAQGLDAQGQRGDVQQQQALDVAAQHAALDGRADATHSSGLMPLKPSLPVRDLTSCTAGMRLEPPTSRTLLMSLGA
jgi:hypothetical protein